MILAADSMLISIRWKANKQVVKTQGREWGNIDLLLFGSDPWLEEERKVMLPALRELFNVTPEETAVSEEHRQKLIERIKDGTGKLWERWRVIETLPGGSEQRAKFLGGWDTGIHLLQLLCNELVTGGFQECIYSEKPPAGCLVCPIGIGKWRRENCLFYTGEIEKVEQVKP